MKIIKSFWIWFSIMSILICLNNYFGNDEKNILLIGLNPLLNSLIYKVPYRHWLLNFESSKNVIDSMVIKFNPVVYMIHFVSYLVTGLIIDLLFKLLRRSVNHEEN